MIMSTTTITTTIMKQRSVAAATIMSTIIITTTIMKQRSAAAAMIMSTTIITTARPAAAVTITTMRTRYSPAGALRMLRP